jgi:hypothetical protein
MKNVLVFTILALFSGVGGVLAQSATTTINQSTIPSATSPVISVTGLIRISSCAACPDCRTQFEIRESENAPAYQLEMKESAACIALKAALGPAQQKMGTVSGLHNSPVEEGNRLYPYTIVVDNN